METSQTPAYSEIDSSPNYGCNNMKTDTRKLQPTIENYSKLYWHCLTNLHKPRVEINHGWGIKYSAIYCWTCHTKMYICMKKMQGYDIHKPWLW